VTSIAPNADDPEKYVEILRFGGGRAACVVTCEHASERLPAPWTWPEEDGRLQGTHWAFDPGARELALELARELETVAVLARFSRLLADPNRPQDSPELFRKIAEGRPVFLNADMDAADRERRLIAWTAFHAACDREVGSVDAPVALAMHTFTPLYEGTPRAVEVGVLFDEETALADGLTEVLRAAGFRVEQNEPYSGKGGLMYSIERHARRHGRRPVELEIRQDLAVLPEMRARVVGAVAAYFRATFAVR
jgi:predicted N-formylglutamate amidohydrolase